MADAVAMASSLLSFVTDDEVSRRITISLGLVAAETNHWLDRKSLIGPLPEASDVRVAAESDQLDFGFY